MKNYITYVTATGRITQAGMCQDENVLLCCQPHETSMEGVADPNTQYVSGGVVVSRPPMGVSIDKTSVVEGEPVTILNVPLGATVIIDNEVHTVNDGVLIITFDTAGTYNVVLWCFPHQDWEARIVCN